MNETTPFFQSWSFYLCLGLVIGAIVGWFVCAICTISGQASRDEEWTEEEADKRAKEIADIRKIVELLVPTTKGKPDRV